MEIINNTQPNQCQNHRYLSGGKTVVLHASLIEHDVFWRNWFTRWSGFSCPASSRLVLTDLGTSGIFEVTFWMNVVCVVPRWVSELKTIHTSLESIYFYISELLKSMTINPILAQLVGVKILVFVPDGLMFSNLALIHKSANQNPLTNQKLPGDNWCLWQGRLDVATDFSCRVVPFVMETMCKSQTNDPMLTKMPPPTHAWPGGGWFQPK